jgi:hypothetical protein
MHEKLGLLYVEKGRSSLLLCTLELNGACIKFRGERKKASVCLPELAGKNKELL